MATHACQSCGGAVDLPDAPSELQFACPHCGGVIGGPPPVAAHAPAPELAPLPPSIANALDRDARTAAASENARSRGGYRPTTGRTDAGEAVALMGISLAVPAVFAGPWLHPMALGFGGMGLCLLGLITSRRKFIPAIGIILCGACTAGGVLLTPFAIEVAIKLGLLTPS